MKNVLFVMKLREDEKNALNSLDGYHFTFAENWDLPAEVFEETDIICGNPRLDVLSRFPKVRWLQLLSAGANQYKDISSDILLTNAYDVFGEAISEYMVACAMMAEKLFPAYLDQQKERVWKRFGEPRMIMGSKVLAVGMGSIGTGFVRKMHLLGAETYGVRRTVHDKPDFLKELYAFEQLDEILPQCDIVGLSLPETAETSGMFDYDRLSSMKDDSILINVGRGSAIDTDALLRLLDRGKFRAVCLDVTDPEPLPLNHPLWNAERVFITPHISGGSSSDIIRGTLLKVIIENMTRIGSGLEPVHIVDRNLGY